MSRKSLFFLTLFMLTALVLAACGGSATPAPAAEPTAASSAPAVTKTVTIGFTASQTGKYNVESSRQINGLNLWIQDVNNAGGIKLSDGTVVTFASKFYDDESNGDRVQELYTRLSTDDKADFLISPYSSGLTSSASVIAEQNGKVMITTGAASASNYQQGYSLVYQAYTPDSKYLTGAADLLKADAPDVKRIAIVHENDKFSTGVAEALKSHAEDLGYEIVLFEGYDSGTTDFAPFINKIQASNPEAILGGGHFQDGSTFARQLNEKGIATPYVGLLVAPPEPSFAELGDAAVGIFGPSQWEPLAAFTPESAQAAGLPWKGITGAEFVQKFQAAHNEEPSYHAGGGYVAGLILQDAIERAGTLDGAAVQAALDATDMLTFFGRIKFDTSAENHGLQIGHEMVYVQWQRDSAGNLVKQVVWPPEGRTAPFITR